MLQASSQRVKAERSRRPGPGNTRAHLLACSTEAARTTSRGFAGTASFKATTGVFLGKKTMSGWTCARSRPLLSTDKLRSKVLCGPLSTVTKDPLGQLSLGASTRTMKYCRCKEPWVSSAGSPGRPLPS